MKLMKKRDDLKTLSHQTKQPSKNSTIAVSQQHEPPTATLGHLRKENTREEGDDQLTESDSELSAPCETGNYDESEEEQDGTHSQAVVSRSSKEMTILGPDEETENYSCKYESKRIKLDPEATVAWTRVHVASKRKQEPALPMPFDLPRNFQPKIQAGLDEKNLTGRTRAKFITTIAEAIYRFKSYPTKEEYEHVANQMVKQWPFLETRTGHGYLVEALKERMAYLRKPDGQKRGKAKITLTPSTPVRPMMPSPRVVMVPPSEDRASYERHLKCLKQECKNVRPNKQVTKELMRRTFPFRRQDILGGSFTMEVLFTTYPPLKDSEEIVREFNRIMEKSIAMEIKEIWGDLAPKIIELARQEVDNHRIEDILENLPEELPEDGNSVLAMCLLYYLLPDTRVKPDHRRVLTLIEEGDSINDTIKHVPTAQPCIVVRGNPDVKEAVLVVEKKPVTTFPPNEAPLVLLGAFYAFNMHYTEGCKNFYTFLEVVFLKCKKPAKKTRLTAVLAKLSPSY